MVSSVGYGTGTVPSMYREQVSGGPPGSASAIAGTVSGNGEGQQGNTGSVTAPGVSVSISPQGAAAAARDSASSVASQNAADAGEFDDLDVDGTAEDAGPASAASTSEPGEMDGMDSADGTSDADDPDSADAADASATADTGSETDGAATPSAAKSFTYGVFGLERPDKPQQDENKLYTAGRWVAAGLMVGGLVSLFV